MKILVTENQLKKLINLITEDGDKINVMFVGDSLSSGVGYTWNYLIAKEHPEWNITHVTEGGKKTDWMLTNMLSKLSKKKYDKVFIWGGTNDAGWVGTDLSLPVTNIQKMVDATNAQGGQAYVFIGYDAASVMADENLKPTKNTDGTILCDMNCMYKFRERWVKLQKDIASNIKNAVIIPTIQGDKNWAPGDGIHIGPTQHRIIKDHVTPYIKQSSKSNNTSDNQSDEKKENFRKFFENYFKFLEKNKDVDESSRKNDIKRMQIVLYMCLRKNLQDKTLGTLDSETKNDIKEFQKNNSLEETGYFDVQTQQAITKKLFPSYTPKENRSSNSKESVDNVQVIENPGVQVRNIPSNVEEQFKNIPGVDYNKFKSDVETIGIPVKFAIRQLFVESAFLPDVISCKRKSTSGAMGLAQFMPTTWPTFGKGGDPCKPQDALPAYVRFMTQLVKRFPGRLDLVFAGYNSGPNFKFPTGPNKGKPVYDDALKNKIPFKDLKGIIPSETYAYSSSILQP